MLTLALTRNLPAILVVWTVAYVADYYLTIIGARLYRAGANQKMVLSGSYELNPIFEKDIDALRLFSPQFWARWLISVPLFILLWLLSVRWADMPELFAVGVGMLALREVPVLLRHARNLFTFKYAGDSDAMQGQIQYARWFSLKSSAFEVLEFAVLFAVIALLTQEWLFVGGALGCTFEAGRHWRLGQAASVKAAAQTQAGK